MLFRRVSFVILYSLLEIYGMTRSCWLILYLALEQVGIQFVSSLAQAATTVISQGLPQMMGRTMGGNFSGPVAPQQQNGTKKGKKGGKNTKAFSQSDVSIPDSNDPGYQAAISAKEPINLLAGVLGVGTDKGVDWAKFDPSAVNVKGGITFIDTMINHTLKSTQWTDGVAST